MSVNTLLNFGMGGFGDGDEYKPSYPPPSHYLAVGHEGHHGTKPAKYAEMWMHAGGRMHFKKPTPKVRTHWDWGTSESSKSSEKNYMRAPVAFGRVDHQKKQISIAGERMHPGYDKALGAVQARHPDYEVHEFATPFVPSRTPGNRYRYWIHGDTGKHIPVPENEDHDDVAKSRLGVWPSTTTPAFHRAIGLGHLRVNGSGIEGTKDALRKHALIVREHIKRAKNARHTFFLDVHDSKIPRDIPTSYEFSTPSQMFSNYASVGHDDSHNNDLWWMSHRGLQTLKSNGLHHVDVIGPGDWLARGRVDHDKQEISIKQARLMPSELTQRTAAQAEQELKERWPAYEVKHFASELFAASDYTKAHLRLTPKQAQGINRSIQHVHLHEHKIGEVHHRVDYVKAKPTDRIRSKLANIADVHLDSAKLSELGFALTKSSTYGLRSADVKPYLHDALGLKQ